MAFVRREESPGGACCVDDLVEGLSREEADRVKECLARGADACHAVVATANAQQNKANLDGSMII